MDWVPFEDRDVHIDLICGRRPDGHWHGTIDIKIRTATLRRLGLHPDQPTSAAVDPPQPRWWRAEAKSRMYRARRGRNS